MILLIDLATMAIMHPGGIPATDLSLVRGDKLPLRITLLDEGTPVTPSGTRPALAVKTALGDDTLVLAATNLEPVDDALGLAYVGSLSVNTTQLIAAMGSADHIDLVGEVVLIGGDGTQRTSSLLKVRVRQDIMPADVVPPDDVVVNWEEMVAASLANQLPDALRAAGVQVTPSTGSSLLDTGVAETPTMMACYAMSWGDELLAGHLTDHSRVRQVVMTYLSGEDAHGSYWLRIWRLVQGAYVVVGVSDPVTLPGGNEPVTWAFTPGVSLTRGDKIILEVCTGADADHLVTYALGAHGVMTPPKDGRGRADQVSHPVVITQYDVAPRMTVTVDYDDGVLVGGVEVATVTQVQDLGTDVRTAAGNSQAAAQSAAAARDQAQAAVNGLTITTGTITTGEPGSQATATLTPGSTPGSWIMDMAIPRGDVGTVDTSQAYTWTQPQTYDAMINANGGVRVPLPSTAQEAISYEALIEQRAADDWRRMGYYMETLIPSWVTTIVRQMQMSAAYNVGTANVSIKEGVYGNDWQDMLVTMTKAAGISLIGCSTGAWKFANYMGNSRNRDYAAASVWRIIGSDKVSILLGSTAQGYSSATNPAADCYAHPIHWVDYAWDNANYRYPLINSVNGATSRDMTPAWQVTIYPKGYLGSSTSCLLRGTDYGRDVGDQQYMWALAPSVTYLSVAITPRQSADHANVENRWEMFVDGHYVMPMTSLFCGSGNTACFTAKAKAHEVSSTMQVGLRMGGMRIDAAPALGVTDVWPIMERVVMRDATVKPMPEVTASALEVSAEGGEVTLTASSALAEAIYVLNDTMCGHDPSAVWCSQSAEQIPAGGGQITLTLAPNTTGQPRQVWAFVGHHYAQAAVIKINQLAQ